MTAPGIATSPSRAPPLGSAQPKLLADRLSKRYGQVDALKPTDLTVETGEFLTLLGPSGSGKTTLLQLICGLTEPTTGRIFIDGYDETTTPVHRRDIGVVFQNYALFPHLTVEENVSFPLKMRKLPAAELRTKVENALEMVGLGHLQSRFPRELSGGQQQRVALARCFVYQPALILMDEPLGALDRKLRESMQIEIKRLHRESGTTIIFVTHDQEEALALSDRICLMNLARVEQIGTPQEIYDRPRSSFVADFIGLSNLLRGQVEHAALVAPEGIFPLPSDAAAPNGETGALIIRPEHIDVGHINVGAPDQAGMVGRIIETVYGGPDTRLLVRLPTGLVMTARRAAGQDEFQVGDQVSLRWSPDRARFLGADRLT